MGRISLYNYLDMALVVHPHHACCGVIYSRGHRGAGNNATSSFASAVSGILYGGLAGSGMALDLICRVADVRGCGPLRTDTGISGAKQGRCSWLTGGAFEAVRPWKATAATCPLWLGLSMACIEVVESVTLLGETVCGVHGGWRLEDGQETKPALPVVES